MAKQIEHRPRSGMPPEQSWPILAHDAKRASRGQCANINRDHVIFGGSEVWDSRRPRSSHRAGFPRFIQQRWRDNRVDFQADRENSCEGRTYRFIKANSLEVPSQPSASASERQDTGINQFREHQTQRQRNHRKEKPTECLAVFRPPQRLSVPARTHASWSACRILRNVSASSLSTR